MRRTICLFLVTAILGVSTLGARDKAARAVPSGDTSARQAAIKEKLLQVPPGSMIEVRLVDKQKLRGRLGEIDNEGFNLTAVEKGKFDTRKIAFTELRSFKKVGNNKAGHTLVWVLAGIGVVVVVAIIVAATKWQSS